MIEFGTDGWRAILDKDFTEENVKRVTLAIGKYVAETFGYTKTILVGFDPRRMADIYAKRCAEILADKGFKVLLSTRVLPTPVLAYNAKLLNASAIMFTASHNPADYLGMKYIERGYITRDEYENLHDYLYVPYNKMGGNGSAERIMDEVKKLPIREHPNHLGKSGSAE